MTHPANRTEEARELFEWGEEVAKSWNETGKLGCTDWRTRGQMEDGNERCYLASLSGSHDLDEGYWYQVNHE